MSGGSDFPGEGRAYPLIPLLDMKRSPLAGARDFHVLDHHITASRLFTTDDALYMDGGALRFSPFSKQVIEF